MDKTNSSSEYPTDYIDIVNEINDFIASLDAPPLDSHTQDLVGTSERHKFGQHGDDFSECNTTAGSWSSSRSRHASGEQNSSKQLSCLKQDDSSVSCGEGDDAGAITVPFPCVDPETDPGYGIYDNRDLNTSKSSEFGEYSDCSNYGGVYSDTSSVSGGDVADSDSGCYSHYQHPRSDAPAVYSELPFQEMSSSSPSTFSLSSHSFSGHITSSTNKSQPHISPSSSSSSSPSSSPKHLQHYKHLRPQSPDRLSAEFLCDPDVMDRRFHQAGSSAHTLTASSNKPFGYDPNDQHYQEPSNIPKIPESPVPKRRSPANYHKFGESQTQLNNSSTPLSTSLHYHCSPSSSRDPQAPQFSSYNSPHKLNIRNIWPPPNNSNELSKNNSSPSKFSGSNTGKDTNKEKQQEDCCEISKSNREGHGSEQHPIPIPITRVPDLSVLISELRSASPRSECSPNSSYTSTARSQSISPKPKALSPTRHAGLSENQDPHHQQAHPVGHHQSRSEYATPRQIKQSTHKSTNQIGGTQITPGYHSNKAERALSPTQKQLVNGVSRRSESPEHDYEPIENLQLEVPSTPRPQTKFPHPQGAPMADIGGQQPKHVKALHNFKGANNDELCFKKGDIITVTQCVEGGWWEGTLNGRTGWFPLNYTKEIKTDISYKNNKTGEVPVYKRESMQLYHNVVLKNVIETEKTHVSEMLRVLQSYIKPLQATSLLTAAEYTQLVGNVEEIIAFQQSFLAALEECEKLPSSQRRIGGIFMQFAPRVKELYSDYCGNHPKAVSVLQKKRDELGKFVETQGAPSPGAQTLTTILSKPFTRLDRYPSLLKELERHVEESHPDRGDTQRAIAVYRNIANSCLEIRKLKEMEFEIITSTIQGWEGEEIAKLGEVIHLSQVKMITQTGDKYERIFVLFSSCLVMLSMSSRLSSYHYEGKIPLSGLTANPCENTENFQNAFEISGPMIEKITVLCGTKMEVTSWLDILNQQLTQSANPTSSTKPQPLQIHMTTTCQTNVSTVTPAKTAQISSNPPSAPPPQFPLSSKTSSVWSLTCLRPSPPLRPVLMCREEVLKSPRAGRKANQKRKPDDPKMYNEDAFILQVIEAYCNSIKTRHTVNSSILNSPQILLAEEEKIFDESELQERTVVDTVYALQDRVKDLEQEQRRLRLELEEEKKCRKKLELLVSRQQGIKCGAVDGVQDVNS